jgi:hypothetical protein
LFAALYENWFPDTEQRLGSYFVFGKTKSREEEHAFSKGGV